LPGAQGRPARRATRRVGRLLGRVPASGDVALIRLVRRGTVLERLGVAEDPGLPTALPGRGRPATVATPTGRWRIVQRDVGRGIVVQAASPLAPLQERRDALRGRLLVAGAGGVLVTGLLALLLAGPALRALTRLRADAGRVASTDDLAVRAAADRGPVEVRELASTINAMLERLQRSDAERRTAHEATRRCAADAGHELRTPLTALTTTVQAMRDHPDLGADDRAEMLGEVAEEHARLIALVDALQALARGEAAADLEPSRVDVAEVAGAAVVAARAAAPGTTIDLEAPDSAEVDGWAPGVRLLLDNLLVNAVRHGTPDGRIVAGVERTADAVMVTVDDDGPGIPPAERATVLERFARGTAATSPGSGLGLALVRQQARLHGGDLHLEDAPLGGLRVRVLLRGIPPSPGRGASPR
ncbi:sensor histidine kinase KdpD, partial [Patulibacter sp.]|uniref:sensor histidine kinase n=1 Tax=Patulibacter sp. TaxID=1912859 RepID=UPI002724AA81